MQTMSPESLVSQLNWRYAVKKFDASKKIPEATWRALEQSVQLAPSSYGLSPWKFVVVSDAGLRAKLRPLSWNQSQITDASHLVVLCRKRTMTTADVDRFVKRIAEVRGVPEASIADYKKMIVGTFTGGPLSDPKNVDQWTAKQVYLALGFLLESAAVLGVDACPMEGFDAEKYDEVLGLKGTDFASTVVATLGYRAGDDWLASAKKVRFAEGEVIVRK